MQPAQSAHCRQLGSTPACSPDSAGGMTRQEAPQYSPSPVWLYHHSSTSELTLPRCRGPSPLARKYRAPFRGQLRELSGRAAANARRHPGLIAVNWGATLVVSIGLGAQNRPGCCLVARSLWLFVTLPTASAVAKVCVCSCASSHMQSLIVASGPTVQQRPNPAPASLFAGCGPSATQPSVPLQHARAYPALTAL